MSIARGLSRWRTGRTRGGPQTANAAFATALRIALTDAILLDRRRVALARTLAPHLGATGRRRSSVEQSEHCGTAARPRAVPQRDARPRGPGMVARLRDAAADRATASGSAASRWGWHDQAIAVAAQQRLFNDYELLYPQPFDRQVRAAAQVSDLPTELIYSVMRQESLYRADAVSSAGARGLLQMVPDTARRTARAFKRPRPTPDDLFDPNVAVVLALRTSRAGRSLRWPDDRRARCYNAARTPPRAGFRSSPSSGRVDREHPVQRERAPTCSASSGTTSCSGGSRGRAAESGRVVSPVSLKPDPRLERVRVTVASASMLLNRSMRLALFTTMMCAGFVQRGRGALDLDLDDHPA